MLLLFQGRLEAFDPRTRRRINGLNCRPLLGLNPSYVLMHLCSFLWNWA